ncbi:CYTH domain-containing protein [Pararhizobium antarcticum]|uniref:Adenylate cyclase n=1 Tax=Pararhizobium antarcticum TaxID=1798805 RepID=A0A657LZR0_9HYPH|nr:CYTH domain-containing protein [Pararhizobium antarcticum]OJF96593.1 adenylate cyclase [Rhizobium sp. 58]OJG01402.1 adenylate cyclase [Pararhizobium antarcticum]
MAKEIERKFLVSGDGWRSEAETGSVFQQAYIVTMDDRSVRVRIADGKSARMTLKVGKSAVVRDEFEYEIPLSDALAMIDLAVGIVIEKTRYRVPFHGFVWEVDVYDGALQGLVIAEVEMRSEDDRPDLPDWIGREVSGERRFSNQYLALDGRPPD